jgi:hypothetical protein
MKKGFSEAKNSWIFKIDADILNTKAEWIEKFWKKTSGGFELVSGQWKHDPIYWALTYYVIKPHVDLLLPGLSDIPLLNSGMYLVNRDRIVIDNFGDGWGFDTMMHIEFYLSRLLITTCEIEPVKDYLRPQSQYFKTAADTIEVFEKVRRDPRFLKGA